MSLSTEELLAELWKQLGDPKAYALFVDFSSTVVLSHSNVYRTAREPDGRNEMDDVTTLSEAELLKRRLLANNDLAKRRCQAEALRRVGCSWREFRNVAKPEWRG